MESFNNQNFSKLPKDVLFKIALEFSLPQLLKFCSSSKRINQLVCEKDDIYFLGFEVLHEILFFIHNQSS